MSDRGALRDLEARSLWLCSDLHGHWDDYAAVRSAFERQAAEQDALVFLGDLIHARGYGYADQSLRIINDLRLRPDARIVCLLGNHELMHLYHWHVSRGRAQGDYVAEFEQAMGADRAAIMRWLAAQPVALRWQNGLLHHTGASERVLRTDATPTYPFVREWDHGAMLARICEQSGSGVRDVWGHFQPQLGEYFATTRTGRFVWDSWFTKNEQLYGARIYENLVTEMLDVYSAGYSCRLQWLVTGHIPTSEGYALVGERQLRLCSSAGASPAMGRLLCLQAAASYRSAADLVAGLRYLRDGAAQRGIL